MADAAISDFMAHFRQAIDSDDAGEFSAQTVLAELEAWDSVAALGVIVMCDMEYGVTITGNDLKGCVTIGDIHGLIAKKKG